MSLSSFQTRLAAVLASHSPQLSDLSATALAGVAVIVAPDPDCILLIRRAERTGDPWSGQMGLPGGRHAAGDRNLLDTAIREAREEVGIVLEPSSLLGPLDDVSPRTPTVQAVVVRPYVFAVPSRPPLILSDEVAQAIWVEVGWLRAAETYRPYALRLREEERTFPAYYLGEHVVWGMTERILTSLLELVGSA